MVKRLHKSNEIPAVLLVQPPVDLRFRDLDMTYTRLAPSSGLAILACETERRLGQPVDMKVYYDPPMTEDFFRTASDCDVLCLSTWFSNYENGLRIARIAKKRNADLLVVFGGVNATNLARRILDNRQYVDLVVCGDGEDVLWCIISGQEYFSIPNLWYRDDNALPNFTNLQWIDLDSVGLWDFHHSVRPGLENYDFRHPNYQYTFKLPPIGLSMTRGCLKVSSTKGRCDYCSIPYRGMRVTDPDAVWDQVRHLQDMHGIEMFFETGDDFTLRSYLSRLVDTKPSDIRFHLRIYASPWALTEKCVEMLSSLGVYEVFLGVETANEEVLRRAGHVSTTGQVLNALDRLEKANISVCLPFLFGLPGETIKSLRETADFATKLVNKYSNIRMVLISLAIPLIGSAWFDRLRSDQRVRWEYGIDGGNLDTDDVFNYYRLLELSVQKDGKVTMRELLAALETLRKRLEGSVVVGCFGGIESMKDNLRHCVTSSSVSIPPMHRSEAPLLCK